MNCLNCGEKIDPESKCCTFCGYEINQKSSKIKNVGWSIKKVLLFILVTIVSTSFVWYLILGSFGLDVERESVSIVSSMLEIIGRQEQEVQNSQEINELILAGLNDECFNDFECIKEVESRIISLQAINKKELEEIDNLWSSGPIVEDFSRFYKYISPQNKEIIKRIIQQYFPEESEKITNSVELL
jgi:predicted nucleic acid-binding Zn ribbon protein